MWSFENVKSFKFNWNRPIDSLSCISCINRYFYWSGLQWSDHSFGVEDGKYPFLRFVTHPSHLNVFSIINAKTCSQIVMQLDWNWSHSATPPFLDCHSGFFPSVEWNTVRVSVWYLPPLPLVYWRVYHVETEPACRHIKYWRNWEGCSQTAALGIGCGILNNLERK